MPSGRNKVVFLFKYGLFCTVDPIGFKGNKTWAHEYGIFFQYCQKVIWNRGRFGSCNANYAKVLFFCY